MAIKNVNGIHDKSVVVSTSGNIYNVGQDALVVASGNDDSADGAIYERNPAPVGRNTFNIDGRVVGYVTGIETFGNHDHINIGANGEVSADHAVLIHGDDTTLSNRGNIVSADGYGILYDAKDVQVHNYGAIKAALGIFGSSTDGATVTNEASGRIYGALIGVGVFPSATSDTFVNHGVVRTEAGQTAYSGNMNNDTVVNDGVLRGSILLGDGQDMIDTRGGVITGSIVGGNGDDILVTDSANYKLVEDVDGGRDTVKSTVSYTLSANVEVLKLIGSANIDGTGGIADDSLVGNAGNNNLAGGSGFDVLFGGKGNDVMSGGSDSDRFHFATGGGHDTITDFAQMEDRVDLSAWLGVNSFTEVMDHAHDQNDGVLIRAGQDSLLILGLSKAELTNSDFVFVT